MWIQVRDSDDLVIRLGDTKRSPREGTSDYRVSKADYPDTGSYDTVHYDGSTFTVVHDDTAHKAALEPALIAAYRKWQDALTLSLECTAMCQAEYDALKAEYDAIGD